MTFTRQSELQWEVIIIMLNPKKQNVLGGKQHQVNTHSKQKAVMWQDSLSGNNNNLLFQQQSHETASQTTDSAGNTQ